MRDANHRGFSDRGVTHQCVLERYRTDPLAARFDQVLRPILNLHRTALVNRDDISRLEPPIVCKAIACKAIAAVSASEVRSRDPGPTHLKLAHGRAVVRDQTIFAARAKVDEREWTPLLRALAVPRTG